MNRLQFARRLLADRWCHALARTGWYRVGHPGLTILGYHQVIEGTPDPVENFDGTMIGREAFTQQLAVLQKHYELVSLADWPRLQKQNEKRRLLAITFDDGYADNATVAWPILRERRIPATFFITTGFVDGTLRPWSDRLRSAIAKTTRKSLTLSEASQSPIRIETQSEKINCLPMLFKHLKQLDDGSKERAVAELYADSARPTILHQSTPPCRGINCDKWWRKGRTLVVTRLTIPYSRESASAR